MGCRTQSQMIICVGERGEFMTALKPALGLIILSLLMSGTFSAVVLAQSSQPPLGNVTDEDDPGLAQILQQEKEEQDRVNQINHTYDFSKTEKGEKRGAAAAASGDTSGASLSEIDELSAKPWLKTALETVRGELYKGDWINAINQLEAIVRKDPASITARRFLAYAYLRSGSADTAIRQLKDYTKTAGTTAADDYLLGDAYNTIGDLENARDAFKGAITKEPNMDSARSALVKVLISLYDYDAALAVCRDRLSQTKDLRTQAYYKQLADSIVAQKRQNSVFPIMPRAGI
jgi:predicted Zn-dependent protease